MVHPETHHGKKRKMTKELVSVILPVFKANPDFLDQSVRSIVSQSYDEIELVIVLDRCNSSVDNSAFAVLEQFHDDNLDQ